MPLTQRKTISTPAQAMQYRKAMLASSRCACRTRSFTRPQLYFREVRLPTSRKIGLFAALQGARAAIYALRPGRCRLHPQQKLRLCGAFGARERDHQAAREAVRLRKAPSARFLEERRAKCIPTWPPDALLPTRLSLSVQALALPRRNPNRVNDCVSNLAKRPVLARRPSGGYLVGAGGRGILWPQGVVRGRPYQ